MTPAGVAGERAELFAYDPGAALDFRAAAPAHVVSTGARVEDVTFASPCGGRAPAYLVVPPGGGPFAAVLFMHAGQLDRNEFLDEGLTLADRGLLSLLVGAPFTRREPMADDGTTAEADASSDGGQDVLEGMEPGAAAAVDVQTVVDLRRALDLLEARADVDPARVAYVGHSYGASLGAIVLALEPDRLRAAVLTAGHPANSEFWRNSPTVSSLRDRLGPDKLEAYIQAIEPLDPVAYLPRVSCPVLLQWAHRDEFITPADAGRFSAAPRPSRPGAVVRL